MTIDQGPPAGTFATLSIEVVAFGECMASFVAVDRGPMAEATRYLRTIAGAEANVAVGLARLGHRVSYIGRVGGDGLGTAVARELRKQGVDVDHLRVDPDAPTGIMIRDLRDLGPSEVTYRRAGAAGSRLTTDDIAAVSRTIETARWLHTTGITPALSATAAAAQEAAIGLAQAAGVTVSLDINLRRRLWSESDARPVLVSLARRATVVLGGLDELGLVSGSAGGVDAEGVARDVLALGPQRVVVKLGAEGALEAVRGGDGTTITRSPAYPIPRVVDPVGAGDAFCAGYIAARLEDRPSVEALAWGNACGAAVASSLGDQAGSPTRAELEHLLAPDGRDTLR
jgi:2-dehydro-3-deoxygluconokinase